VATVIEPAHWGTRDTTIGIEAKQVGPGAVWLIGDSITEAATWSTLGNFPVLNMGYGGARLETIHTHVVNIAPSLPPPGAAIVMISINNACLPDTDPEQVNFQADYSGLVTHLKQYTPHIALMTVTPFERGFAQLDPIMDQLVEQVAFTNAAIRANASYYGLPLYDANAMARQADYTAITGFTVDGVHPSPAGYAALKSVMYIPAAEAL
jgi:GDSL-like Lipase/Acylhydrolase family